MTLGIFVCTMFLHEMPCFFPWMVFVKPLILRHISAKRHVFSRVANPCDSSETTAVIRTNRNLWEDWDLWSCIHLFCLDRLVYKTGLTRNAGLWAGNKQKQGVEVAFFSNKPVVG